MEMANRADTTEVEATTKAALGAKPKTVKRQNEQSSIAFPYMDMDAGISVARAIFGAGGVPLSRDQLAGVMNTNSGSGTFITKTATSRMFGLIASVQGKYELTNLGFAITDADEMRERAARAEAFKNVPLYRRVYDEFKGKQLPPRPHGLEQVFAKFGVAPKQTYNARLAFDRSASQAGFFSAGPDRLIEPILFGPVESVGQIGQTSPTGSPGSHERLATEAPIRKPAQHIITPASFTLGGDIANLDPLILGLLTRLPKGGEKWEIEKRAKWLQTFAANLDIVYTSDENDKIIIIECKPAKT